MDWDELFTLANLKFMLVGQFPDGPAGGLLLTFIMGAAAIFFSTLLGTPLGIMRSSKNTWVQYIAGVYIEIMRALPLVLVVFWLWFVPPIFGVEVSGPATTVIALSLFTSAYVAEILRGGFRSVTRGQSEAAYALGLGYIDTMRFVILPQVFRFVIPPLTGRYVVTMKNTSLAFLIGIRDFTGTARLINIRILAPIEVYAFSLVVYYFLNKLITFAMFRLEDKLRPELRGELTRPTTRDIQEIPKGTQELLGASSAELSGKQESRVDSS